MTGGGPGLEVAGVTVRLDGRVVLDDVTTRVGPGELVGLVGPNGAGKTTLLRAVLGLVAAERGTVTLAGRPVHAARGLVGYVPQRHEFAWDFPIDVAGAVLNGRTGRVGLLRRPGRADRAAAAEAVDRVQLGDLRRRSLRQLSGGQRQRVLLARALALRPEVLLLDEPFTAVDVPTQELLARVLVDAVADGTAVLMTTHDLAGARTACSRLVLLNRRVVADAAPVDLVGSPAWATAFGVPDHEAVARDPAVR